MVFNKGIFQKNISRKIILSILFFIFNLLEIFIAINKDTIYSIQI